MVNPRASSSLIQKILFTRWPVRLLILLTSFLAAVFGLLAPFFQKEFVDLLTENPQSLHTLMPEIFYFLFPSGQPTPLLALTFSFFFFVLYLAMNVTTNYLGSRESVFMQRILSQDLYEHILKLRTDSLRGKPVGEFVSIYATDVPGATVLLEQSLPVGASILFPFILAPLALVTLFGLPLGPTMILLTLLVAVNLMMAFRQSKFFFLFKKLAADRIGLVNEWIQNIRALRILGWVNAFEKNIFQTRKVETQNRIAMVTNGQTMNAISSSVTFLLNLLAIVAYVHFSAQELSPGTLLALLWIVAFFLTRPFRQLPWFFTFLFDSITSARRLASVMELKNEESSFTSESFSKLKSLEVPNPVLQITNLNLTINQRKLLKNIDLKIQYGEFVTIVGEVGSGKSLLLLSLLGETGARFDSYLIGENEVKEMHLDQLRQFFTYVPQEGFIMSASLRENVAMEYDWDQSKDSQILQSLKNCEFDLSQERVEHGLDTEIGERGVNLSGGQKQRVSLARVDFFRAPIVLLDDCLSAVDVDTENKLIDRLIKGEWKGKTRLLVTHRLSVLKKSDRVIFLQDGRLFAQGTYEELYQKHAEFREFVATVESQQSPESANLETNTPSPPLGIGSEK
ncbi:MAG: ABC transporter ATP-binding protein/permease [Proteobacteria bacterium]|jgi:ABC-type multidrug transport system fused ATPase/permease subunit|nr:ABC transporter ATP-binding protein/permease [Pseudomonadota bacterium]